MTELETGISVLLNEHSKENASDTPDFILAQFLTDCLEAWNIGVTRREMWYGRKVGGDKHAI